MRVRTDRPEAGDTLEMLEEPVRRALEAIGVRRRWRAGQTLMWTGEQSTSAFVVESGRVRIVASSDAVGIAMLTQNRDELGSGTMCLVPVSAPWLRLNYGFIWRRDSAVSAGAREFIAAMRERESGIRSQENELQCRYDRRDPAVS